MCVCVCVELRIIKTNNKIITVFFSSLKHIRLERESFNSVCFFLFSLASSSLRCFYISFALFLSLSHSLSLCLSVLNISLDEFTSDCCITLMPYDPTLWIIFTRNHVVREKGRKTFQKS